MYNKYVYLDVLRETYLTFCYSPHVYEFETNPT
jgi:hypothetical protein